MSVGINALAERLVALQTVAVLDAGDNPVAPCYGPVASDGGRVAVEQSGDLVLFVASSTENINLVSFVLGQVCVVHLATSTWRLMG